MTLTEMFEHMALKEAHQPLQDINTVEEMVAAIEDTQTRKEFDSAVQYARRFMAILTWDQDTKSPHIRKELAQITSAIQGRQQQGF